MYCSFSGADCAQPFIVQLPVLWSMLTIIVGLAFHSWRDKLHQAPPWNPVLAGFVILSLSPHGLGLQLTIHMLAWQSAPLSTSLVITVFGLYAIWTFCHYFVGPDNWARLRRR